MNSRSNQVLIGIILLVFGIFSFAQSFLKINYSNILLVFVGFAFLLLYKTKRKSWSLVLGSYLSYFGVISLIEKGTGLQNIFTTAMFFMVPGVIFLVLYFTKNKTNLLLPGSLLLWFGIHLVLKDLIHYRSINRVLLFICISAAFFMVYWLGKQFIGKWVIYAGALFFGLAVFSLLKIKPDLMFIKYIPQIGSALLIVFSIIIIARAFIKKKQ